MKLLLCIFLSSIFVSSALAGDETTVKNNSNMNGTDWNNLIMKDSSAPFGGAPVLLDVAKQADGWNLTYAGEGLKISQADAIEYCSCNSIYAIETLGCKTPPDSAHLPSLRELAQFAMSLGAQGIADRKVDDSYQKLSVKNADGTIDSFYFSAKGYQRPAGPLGDFGFLSSSVSLDKSEIASGFATGLNGAYGLVGEERITSDSTIVVRCAIGGTLPDLKEK